MNSYPNPHPTTPKTRRPRHTILALATVAALAASAFTATSAASATENVVVSDDFTRASGASWAAAPAGGPYSLHAQSGASFVVSKGTAKLSLKKGKSLVVRPSARKKALNAHASVDMKQLLVAGSTNYYGIGLRTQSDGSQYRGRVHVTASGKMTLVVTRTKKNTTTTLKSVSIPSYNLRSKAHTVEFSVTGRNPVKIEGRVYPKGSTAPAKPQLSYNDSSSARISKSGTTDIWGFSSKYASAVTRVQLDNLKIVAGAIPLSRNVPAAAPQPAPKPTATAAPTPKPTATPKPTPKPTATPAPAPAPAANASRGAKTVGTTSYAVPSGAIYVKAGATASGADGSQSKPYATVQAAVDAAKSGQTIVLRAGVYNEAVTIPYKKSLTVQAYPKEAVWFDGSTALSGWTKSGSTWVYSGWKFEPDTSMQGDPVSRWVDAAYPMANHPDQVFVDGKGLTQVAKASEVVAGTFAVDDANDKILIGTDPTGKEVRASNKGRAFYVQSPDTTLQGFGIRRYASSYEERGAVRSENTGFTARDLVVTDNAMIGLAISNNEPTIERVTVQRNGLLGIGANAAYGISITDSIINDNNYEKFRFTPVAGGIKITRSRGVTVDNIQADGNHGPGVWLDESVYDFTVVNSDFKGNSRDGIGTELSDTGVIANNRVVDNYMGITLLDTGNVDLFNNDFGDNDWISLRLVQDERRQAAGTFAGRDPRMGGVDPTVPWITRNIRVSNNVFGNGGSYSIHALDSKTNRAVDTWNLTITGNVFNNRADGGPKMVSWGLADNKTLVDYNTPEALASAKNSAWKNVMTPKALSFGAMTSFVESSTSIAVGLPAKVASAAGVATGLKRLGTWD